MALSKDDRIQFTAKIVSADLELLGIETSKASLLKEQEKIQKLDQANAKLEQNITALINPYQTELGRYTGIFRTQLTPSIITDSGALKLGNFLFPNDQSNPPPSLSPNPKVWVNVKPYARNVLVGKQYDEAYPAPVSAEISKLNNMVSIIESVENLPLIQRVTGQQCVTAANPTPPPPTIDTIGPNPIIQTAMTDLIDAATDVLNYVTSTQSLIFVADPNPARAAASAQAVNDIEPLKTALNTWLPITNFNTAHGQTTCAGFNAYNPALLGITKFRTAELSALKLAIQNRLALIPTRVAQIEGYLGDIVQNISNGDFTGTGFYFQRINFLTLRLNRLGGSLFMLNGFSTSLNAQNGFQDQIITTKTAYQSLLKCSILSAPTNGTDVIHVKEPKGFALNDTVYLVSNNQEEIALKIASIEGSKIRVGQEIPPKYRPNEGARLYKDLT